MCFRVTCCPFKRLILTDYFLLFYIYSGTPLTALDPLTSNSPADASRCVSLALPFTRVPIQFEYQMLRLISPLYYCLRKTASD